jgi:hypothetical protein
MTMTNLSPAAQAVLDALYMGELNGPQQMMARSHAAAALYAAAEQLHHDPGQSHQVGGIIASRLQLLALAEELETQ